MAVFSLLCYFVFFFKMDSFEMNTSKNVRSTEER